MDEIYFSPLNIKAFLYNEFGMCVCSETDAIIRELCKFFDWIEAKHPVSYQELFGSSGMYYLIAGICDKAQLIEHGVSIRFPFFTLRGKKFFEALKHKAHKVEDASGEAYDGCHYGDI